MPDWNSLLIFTGILCFGIFVQSAAGFAAGLLIVPSLLWCGFSIPEAQASLLVATIPQNLWGVYKFHPHVQRRELVVPGILRLSWLPIGMAILSLLDTLSAIVLRQIVGGILLVVTLLIVIIQPRPRDHVHRGWTFTAFSLSGLLQGLVGMGGPAMVLWVQAHDWDTRRIRGFLFSMYLISLAPAMIFLALFFGERIVSPALTTVLLIPLLLWTTAWGLRAGTWLGRQRLRRLTLALLLLMGGAGLAAPWLTGRALQTPLPTQPSEQSQIDDKLH